MTLRSLKLRTGEELVINMLAPPFPDYAGRVDCWWGDIREELLGGQLKPWLFTPYFVGEIGDEIVGYMSYQAPADTRDVGLVEFVMTAERHRRKGIASALMAELVHQFTAEGGQALYLCTGNPNAGRLYEKHGFWYLVGDGMRYLAPGAQDFDDTYLAFCGAARVRDATWGDIPRASVLYNHPQPRWLVKDYLTQSFRYTRFESHFAKLLKRIEHPKGACVVLENPAKRAVGVAALERSDTFYEQHVATLSFRVAPGYFGQAPELLEAAAQKARERAIRVLQIHIADCDDDQKELAVKGGFSEEARLRDRLQSEDGPMDMLIYTRILPGAVHPLRNQGDYYGGRRPWQEERIAAGRSGSG